MKMASFKERMFAIATDHGAHMNKKSPRILIFISLALALVLAGLYGLAQHTLPYRNFMGIPIGPFGYSDTPVVGRFNGVKLAIPANYIYFPFEYEGESVWDPKSKKPEHTEDSAVNNVALQVHWPSMQPRTPENAKSYEAAQDRRWPSDWMIVGVQINVPPPTDPTTGKPIVLEGNGSWRVLRGRIERLQSTHLWFPKGTDPSVHYELKGRDRSLDLDVATPVGKGSEKSALWNETLYWDGHDTTVSTLIECPNGAYPDPKVVGSCEHRFDLPELNSDITVRYSPNHLHEWRRIQAEVARLIISFRTH